MSSSTKKVAFQGRPGAYSDLACRQVRPDWETIPCASFQETILAVQEGRADQALLPCENNLVGRVPDIHTLLPHSNLFIIGEHFQRIEHCLIGIPGANISDLKRLHTHPVAMGQVSRLINELHLQPVPEFDTAGAVEITLKLNNKEDGAIASSLAAELNGLSILRRNVEDESYNTTRFYIVSREHTIPAKGTENVMTSFLFQVKNIPAALYKVMGGFATNNINMTRLESYMADGYFLATRFLVDIEGHIEDAAVQRALAELRFFSEDYIILGCYPASKFRKSVYSSSH